MGGKGQRRREKNYQSAHGGNARLPPPPNPKELDTLPSKLRKIMELKNPSSIKPGPKRSLNDAGHEKRKGKGATFENKGNPKDLSSSTDVNLKSGDRITKAALDKNIEDKDVTKKRKRKRKEVKDLRFQELDGEAARLSKKARKKE